MGHTTSGLYTRLGIARRRATVLEDPRPLPDKPAKEPLAPIPEPQPHLPSPE